MIATDAGKTERTLLEEVLHYAAILRRYRLLIVLMTAAAGLAAVGFSIVSLALPPEQSPLPNRYSAEAKLVVQSNENNSLAGVLAGMGITPPVGANVAQSPGLLALEVLNSRTFLDQVAEEFRIAERYKIRKSVRTNSRQAITTSSKFVFDRVTGILTVQFTDVNPVAARDIVNRMVEMLNDWFVNRGGTSKQRQKALLEQKLTEISGAIKKLETQVQDFQKKHGALAVEDLAASQTRMLADLRSQLILKDMAIKNYSSISRIEDPQLVRLRSERENLVGLIRQIEEGGSGLGTDMPAQGEFPELALQFRRLSSELDIQRSIWQSLSQQYEIVKLDLASDPVFQTLELAEVPDKKSGPSRASLCLATTVIAFFLSSLLSLILEYVRTHRKAPRSAGIRPSTKVSA